MWPMFQISLKFTKPNLVNQTFDSSSTRSVVGIHSSHSMLPLQASRTHRMNSILLSMPKSPITGFIKNAMDFIYNSHNFYSFLVTCREESRGGGGGGAGTCSGGARIRRCCHRNSGSQSCELLMRLSWCLIDCRGYGTSNGAFPHPVMRLRYKYRFRYLL